MAKVIDELLVAIGLEADDKDFKEVTSTFDQLKSSALQMGAVFAGGLSLDSLTFGFSAANDRMGKFSDFMGTNTELVYDLGRAIEHNGGAADDAYGLIERLAKIQDSLVTGEGIQWMEDVARASGGLFDPSVIRQGQSFEQMLNAVTGQMGKLNTAQRRRVGEALGFNLGTTQTLQSRDYMNQQLDAVRQFGSVSKDMSTTAAAFNDSAQDIRDAALDIRNNLSMAMLPTLIEQMGDVATFYKENRGEITEGIETITPYLETTAKATLALLAFQGGKKGIGFIAANMPAAAAILTGTALSNEFDKKSRGEFNLIDEMGQRWETQKQQWDDFFTFKGSGSFNTQGTANSIAKSKDWKMVNGVPQAGPTNYNTIHINGGNPEEVKRVVYQVINDSAEQTIQDVNVESQ